MAKRFSFLVTVLFLSVVAFAQTKKTAWKEYNSFNTLMAETFHNFEDGNFVPVKTKSAELVSKAQTWSKSAYPVGYDKTAIAPLLTKLVDQTLVLDQAVKAGVANEEVGKILSDLHKQFLKIYDLCTDAKHEQH